MQYLVDFIIWLLTPSSPSDLQARIRRIDMRNVTIELDWQTSHSTDVIRQDITVMTQAEGESFPKDFLSDALAPNVNTYVITVPEKTTVFVKIVAFDGTYYSKPMVNQFKVPDCTVPCPPVNKGWKILEIEDETPCY